MAGPFPFTFGLACFSPLWWPLVLTWNSFSQSPIFFSLTVLNLSKRMPYSLESGSLPSLARLPPGWPFPFSLYPRFWHPSYRKCHIAPLILWVCPLFFGDCVVLPPFQREQGPPVRCELPLLFSNCAASIFDCMRHCCFVVTPPTSLPFVFLRISLSREVYVWFPHPLYLPDYDPMFRFLPYR